MKKHWFMLMAAAGTAAAAAQSDVLFLAHFNRNLEAEVAKGGAKPVAARQAEVRVAAGMDFGKARRGGLDLCASGAFVSYPAAGNFNPASGTLQLWLRPDRWLRGKRTCLAKIFSCVIDPANRGKIESGPGKNGTVTGFLLYKDEYTWNLRFRNYLNWKSYLVSRNVTAWDNDTWHQITLTWGDGRRTLYVDGVPAGSGILHPLKQAPREICFGSPSWGSDAQCVIDEVRILNRPLSAAEVRRDFEARREFPDGKTKEDPGALLAGTPRPVATVRTGGNDRALYAVKEKIPVFYSTKPLRLDGEFNEPVWQQLPPLPAFKRWGKKPGSAPVAPSCVRIAYDKNAIWFNCRLTEPQMEKLRAAHDQRDLAVYEDDCFELVLDCGNSPETTWHIAVNVLGAIYDSLGGDKKHTLRGARAVGKKHDGAWSVELMIPFGDLGKKTPFPGECWGIRCARERKFSRENSSYPQCALALDFRTALAPLEFRDTPETRNELGFRLSPVSFMPGMNRIPVNVVNNGARERRIEMTARVAFTDGRTGKVFRKTVVLPPKTSRRAEFRIPVATLAARQIAFEATEKKIPLWRGGVAPGFAAPSVDPARLKNELRNIDADILHWRSSNPRVADAFGKNGERMRTELARFDAAVDKAIKTGTALDAAVCRKFAAWCNGIGAYLDAHRFTAEEASPWSDGSPEKLPESTVPPRLRFRQGANEWEFRAIDLCGLLPGGVSDWRIGTDELYDAHGKRVSRANLTVYRAPFVRNGAGRLVTDPLVESDDGAFTLLPGRTRRFWIALHSRGMKPGRYVSKLTVKPRDVLAAPRKTWMTIPIEVEILPFKIPETPNFPLDAFLWSGGSTPIVDETPLIGFMKKFHVNHVATDRFRYDFGKDPSGFGQSGPVRLKDSPWQGFRPELIRANDAFLHAAKDAGMKLLFHWNLCRNPAWVKQMSDHLFELGFAPEDFLFSGFHDEYGSKGFKRLLPFHQAVKKLSPRTRFMATVTTVPPPDGLDKAQLRESFRYIQTPVIYENWLWPEKQSRAATMRSLLAEFPRSTPWIYRCDTGAQSIPLIPYYRLGPLKAKLCGVKGIAYWCSAVIYGKRSLRNGRMVAVTPESMYDQQDPEGRWFEGVCFWHPRKILIPTKRMMALVEGLEDCAMISLLEKKEPANPLIAREKLLALHRSADQRVLDAWRREMLAALSRNKPHRKAATR